MRVLQKLKGFMILSLFMFISIQSVWALDNGPVQMLKGVTTQVMQELRANRETLQNNPAALYKLVHQFILPHADFTEMAQWVVGRNAWQKASAKEQEEFIQEFKTLVVRSYAGALLGYTDQKIEFLPLRDPGNKVRVQVSTLVKDGVKKPLHIDYRVVRTQKDKKENNSKEDDKKDSKQIEGATEDKKANTTTEGERKVEEKEDKKEDDKKESDNITGGEWKVYDIIIEGVSLMGGYRAQFAQEAKAGGVKAVTAKIRQHNKSRATRSVE